jgi:hypothetical protein
MSDVEVVNLFGETMAEPWHGTLHGYNYKKCRCKPCKKANTEDQRARRSRNKAKITGDESWHGTYRGYKNNDCRCEPCKKAAADYRLSNLKRNKAKITGDESWHGTYGGYKHKDCRCEPCKKAHSDYQRAQREVSRDKITGSEPWHGTESGYNRGCRCEPCRAAHSLRGRIKRYGISEERVLSLLERMVCKVCRTVDPGKFGWVIDHDHKCCPGRKSCGKCVRELICGSCNHMLGQGKDDPEILRSGADYLELHAA